MCAKKKIKKPNFNPLSADFNWANFSFISIIVIIAVLALSLTIYIMYRASISNVKLFSVGLIALFAGLLFESFRVTESWGKVIRIFIGTYFFSLINFFKYKHEYTYILENHIKAWPYVFIFIFALFFVIFNKELVTAKLTEGITLLMSLSLLYWCVDYGFLKFHNWFALTLFTIVGVLSVFSILNAFTSIELTRTSRLILSIWSSIVMTTFAIDNIFRVFSNQEIENTEYLSEGLYIGIQYFLLGVSTVYMMSNFMLLVAFLPNKNSNYKKDLAELKKDHIKRYSQEQIHIKYSLYCMLYAGIIYTTNYQYQILPRHTTIWFVFFTFPLIIEIIVRIKNSNN